MDLYHSRLTPNELNDLIIKYKIPCDLHPRLPSEGFVMSELPDDAIGIYHQIFDFSGVRIPFSSFLLALIKHYRVHFSQLGPLGLNKVITFEVLCRSLQIEPTVTLFRVFQTLCKQGDWFSFSKCRAPSPVCIDDNRSCIKHWKSGFFLIDRRAIPDAMVWRHPNAAIDDPRPATGSFNMADVCCLSAHVIKLRDMPEGVLVLSGLSRVWKNHFCDPVLWGADGNGMEGGFNCLCCIFWLLLLTDAEVQEDPHLDVRLTFQRLPFYYTPLAMADVVISNPTPEDLAIGTPSSKIVAKAEASHKRKASTSGVASSHVAKCTRSALAQSSSSTTRPSLFVGDSDDESDGDDDACVEISLVTPLRSAVVIPPSGNQGGSSVAPTAEGSNTRGNRQRPSSRPAPSFRDVSGDAIHTDLSPFSVGPYYATYPKDGVAGNFEFTWEDWDAPYRPTFRVRTKEVFKDLAVCKTIMSMLHCMMISHGGELLARYRGLNQSHHENLLSTYYRLKGYEEKFAGLTGLELQVSTLKKQFSRVQGELLSLAASFGFERGLSMHQTKDEFVDVLKKMVNFMPVILQLEPKKLVRPANVPIPRDTRVSPLIAKESTVTPVSTAVDRSDLEMTDGVAHSKSRGVFVQGTSHILDDVAEVTVVGSKCISSGLTDVVVALPAGEKGDGSTPSSTVKEVVVPPSGV
ncbi:hypothetical protein Tco_0060452 [Tanacetum coccineum]